MCGCDEDGGNPAARSGCYGGEHVNIWWSTRDAAGGWLPVADSMNMCLGTGVVQDGGAPDVSGATIVPTGLFDGIVGECKPYEGGDSRFTGKFMKFEGCGAEDFADPEVGVYDGEATTALAAQWTFFLTRAFWWGR